MIILAMSFCVLVRFDSVLFCSYFSRTDAINPLTFQQDMHEKKSAVTEKSSSIKYLNTSEHLEFEILP